MIPDVNKQKQHQISDETIAAFLAHETSNGASANAIRRYKGALAAVYAFLPDDKCLSKERLLAWRKSMEEKGYASVTILNYVKNLNRYLDYVGCSDIRFNKGRGKDIAGMTFGYLTAIEPTTERNRKDIVWVCQCKCGNTVELPATRLLVGNTLSCGCLNKEHLQRANKYIDNTSLRQSMEERVKSTRSVSGYTGVVPKRGKWQAYIIYKKQYHSLGVYADIAEAIKARARGKELVRADAQGLLNFYEEIHKLDLALPSRETEPHREFPGTEWRENNQLGSATMRTDNTTGYVGVNFRNGKWEATIGYHGVRYKLGRYPEISQAISARQMAEAALKDDPEKFVAEHGKK